jgi:hypothetical protein
MAAGPFLVESGTWGRSIPGALPKPFFGLHAGWSGGWTKGDLCIVNIPGGDCQAQ